MPKQRHNKVVRPKKAHAKKEVRIRMADEWNEQKEEAPPEVEVEEPKFKTLSELEKESDEDLKAAAKEPTLEGVAADLAFIAKQLNLVLPSDKARADAAMALASKPQEPKVPEEVPTMHADGEAPGELRPT